LNPPPRRAKDKPMLDLLIRDARLQDREGMVDIGIAGGRIAAVGTGLVCDDHAIFV